MKQSQACSLHETPHLRHIKLLTSTGQWPSTRPGWTIKTRASFRHPPSLSTFPFTVTMSDDENHNSPPSVLGRRKRNNALQLGPRKKAWAAMCATFCLCAKLTILSLAVSVIRLYITDATLAELYTHYAAWTHWSLTGFSGLVNLQMSRKKALLQSKPFPCIQ